MVGHVFNQSTKIAYAYPFFNYELWRRPLNSTDNAFARTAHAQKTGI